MSKRTIKRWLGIALLVLGLGFLGVAGWQYFVADEVDAVGKQSVASSTKASDLMDPDSATAIGDVFARLVAPRLGDKFVRLVGEGTKWHPVLNEIGIGHYIGTARPGEVGNFATAAHRGGFGGTYKNIHRFVDGDLVYVQTNHGWYTYKYLQTKIVKPEDVDVIAPVPTELTGAVEGGSYLTMTACDPIYVNTNRIIVWFELQGYSASVPEAIAWAK